MVLCLSEQDVERLLGMPLAIELVEDAFRRFGSGKAENLFRRRIHGSGGMLHMMAASLPELGFLGYKAYTTYPGQIKFRIYVHDAGTGELLSVMDANRLGQIRTGAASAVATRWLAREDVRTVGILGTGWQARTQLQGVCHVRRPSNVVAFSRSQQPLRLFCQEMQKSLGIPCVAAESSDEVAEASDVLITITNSGTPLFNGHKVRPGVHINAAGSNSLLRREIDEACIRRCTSIVVDSREQAKVECGEFLGPLEKGLLTWEGIRELGEVVTGRVPSRGTPQDITLFKSLGLALEDIAVAGRIYQLAKEGNVGREVQL